VWARGVIGVCLCLAAPSGCAGAARMHGSTMSGQAGTAVLGVVVIVIGLLLLAWANHVRRSRIGAKQTLTSRA